MPKIIEYKTENEWLELRRSDITSSDVAVLFGELPYCTEFELWHRKKNDVQLEFDNNERVKWGKRLEAVVAEGLAEDHGWKIKPLKVYMRSDTCKGLGSSFDYEIEENGKLGILEIKTVDYKEYKSKWLTDGDVIESPTHIELQLQCQLEVADREFGYIAALVSGNNPIVVHRDRDRAIGKLMRDKVTKFWADVAANKEPTPDFQRDTEIIKLLYADASGEEVDLSGNNRFAALVGEYPLLQKAESDAKKVKDACKAEMTMAMGKAALAKCNDVYVTRKTVKRGAYQVAATEYVDFRVKQPKEK